MSQRDRARAHFPNTLPAAALPATAVLVAVIMTLLPVERAVAQGGSAVGISGGYDFGVPLGFQRDPSRISWCNCPGTGRSSSHTAWLGALAFDPEFFTGGFGVSLRLSLEYSAGSFRSDQYMTPPFLDPDRNRIVSALARFDASADILSTRIDALASISLSEFVRLEAGPWARLRIAGRFEQSEKILTPPNTNFPETGRPQRIMAEGGVLAAPALTGGAMAGLRFTSPLGENLALFWDIHSSLDARALAQNLSIRSFSIGAGLSLAFIMPTGFRPEETEETIPQPVIAEDLSPAANPKSVEAKISLYSVNPAGERIHYALVQASQHYHRQSVAFTPDIFFERNSAQIPGRYSQISRSARFSFSTRRLIRRDAIEHYYQILNILGMRLSEQPAAAITIIGSASPDEPSALARARAEAIMIYLRTIWDINPSRMKIETRAPRTQHYVPPEQLRAAEIVSRNPGVLEPMVTDWMVESFRTTPINLDPLVRNPESMRDWTISIAHKNREVARYSSSDEENERELDIGFLMQGADTAEALPPLIAWFSVEDSSGEVTTVTDALDLVFSSDSLDGARSADVKVTTTHVLHTSTLAVTGDRPPNRDLIRELVARLSDGDRVTIRPVIEISGGAMITEQRIRDGIQRLANALLIELGAKDVRISLERGASPGGKAREYPENAVFSELIELRMERAIGKVR